MRFILHIRFRVFSDTYPNLWTDQVQQRIRSEALVDLDLATHCLPAGRAKGGDLLPAHGLRGAGQLLEIWHRLFPLQRHINGHRLKNKK